MLELYGRERCEEVGPAELKTIAGKNRLKDL